jgi:hypothetical protein
MKRSPLKTLKGIEIPDNLCKSTKNVYDAANVYVKTICLSKYAYGNYDEAQEIALYKGLRLYKFDTTNAKTKLFEYLKSLPQRESVRFIDGKTGNDCNNIYYDSASKSYLKGTASCGKQLAVVFEIINAARKLKFYSSPEFPLSPQNR